jgi:uncharacterized protein
VTSGVSLPVFERALKLVPADGVQTPGRTDSVDPETTVRVEAAVARRLIAHLQDQPEVQNIDLMILADFCRNCLAKWYVAAAAEEGVEVSYDAARGIIHGVPYAEWKANQPKATPEQMAAFQARQAARAASE